MTRCLIAWATETRNLVVTTATPLPLAEDEAEGLGP